MQSTKIDFTKFNNGFLVKPNKNPQDKCTSSNQASREKQQNSQEAQPIVWINEFNKKCLKICGTKCSEKLDELMECYIQEIKEEMTICETSPNRAAFVANRMSKMLQFFYLYYSDIKEFFVISQWHENMCTLLYYYYVFELKGVYRMYRGKDTDNLVCTRLMNAFWIYLNNNNENILYIILQNRHIGRKHKDILDPIFRKLLINRHHKTLSELEYIGYLLAFKLWKRLYPKEKKKTISEYALTELKAPISFLRNYKKYKFFPPIRDTSDVHYQFVTGLVDLDNALKEYLELYKNQKKNDFHTTEKTSFISEFCSSFEEIDNSTLDLTDTYELDKVKHETDIQEIEDDDCIIIEDTPNPPTPEVKLVPLDPPEIIDLTTDEPEQLLLTNSDDEIPVWCKDLIKQSEELKITPPISPETEKVSRKPIDEVIATRESKKEVITTPSKEIIPSVEENMPLKIESVMSRNKVVSPIENISRSPTSKEEIKPAEDNSIGLTEITSTSHPVKDVATESSVFISTDLFPDSAKENFEHVDSTSNINEEECEPEIEEPVVKTFVVERTVEDGVVRSEVISELPPEPLEDSSDQSVSAASNIHFEPQSLILRQSDDIVDTSRFVINSELMDDNSTSVASEINSTSVASEIDPTSVASDINPTSGASEINVQETQSLFDNESVGSVISQQEPDDFNSPAMEPISDFANYLSGIDSNNLFKQFNTNSTIEAVHRKRKVEELTVLPISRTYTKRARTSEAPEPKIPVKERRVPLNGERVRFEKDTWEPFYTGTLKLTQAEYKLFMPDLILKKDNPKYYIPDFEKYSAKAVTEEVIQELRDPFGVQQLYNTQTNIKKILERHDYFEPKNGEKNPRARVIVPVTSTAKKQNVPAVVFGAKRGGTVSPDLNINLTLPKFESLSLNSSFQHHFCSDIETCTSASSCFAENTPSTSFEKPLENPIRYTYENVPQSAPAPILPAEVPYWHEIEDKLKVEPPQTNEPPKTNEPFQATPQTNVLVNINVDNVNNDHEIHLPIKKRRVSSLKVEIKDELSYPSTPMISIAELESIETERNKINSRRIFKTPAELKEVPPLLASYNVNPPSAINDNFTTYNPPTINYHVNNVPVINFQYTPHYQLPPIPPIFVPISRNPSANWDGSKYGSVRLPTAGKSETSGSGKKRASQAARTTDRMRESIANIRNKSLKSKRT